MRLRVMSFNVRYAAAPDGPQHWRRRRSLVLSRIRAFQPDLLGLQECQAGAQAAYLRRWLPEYVCLGTQRGGEGRAALEMTPLFCRRAAFQSAGHGQFWLSATPAVPGSRSWESAFPRTAVWARLRPRGGPAELVAVNTHFDHASAAAQTHAAALVAEWLAQAAPGQPAIVMGDFNAGKDSPAYARLTAGGALVDAHPGPAATFHGYGRPEAEAPIDWILASPGWRVVQAAVDPYTQAGLFPSDHYPLTAVLEWTGER